MLLLALWIVGLVFSFFTKCEVELLSNNRNIEERGVAQIIKLNVCEFISIVLVGGMPLGKWINNIPSALTLADVGTLLVMAIVVYAIMFFMLGFHYFSNKVSRVSFILVFVASIVAWNVVL